MVSGINAPSYINMYKQQESIAKMCVPTSIETNCRSTIEDYYISSPEARGKAESEDLSGALKAATSGFGACAKCGAIYIGEMPPICGNCGDETKSDENETPKIEETAKADAVNGVSELSNDILAISELEASVL